MDEPAEDHVQNKSQLSRTVGDTRIKVPLKMEPTCLCEGAHSGKKGRKLIVAFDGTSNKFGLKNTNVVQLYARVVKNGDQHTYYNSGIGTYAKPSWRSLSYLRTVLDNKLDLGIAWNFEKIILGGYRWLSENYHDGDQIFLFGFSRGGYQARVLAGMIERVGLIFPGNQEQIPFAYEVYADSGVDDKPAASAVDNETAKAWCKPASGVKNMAQRFRRVASRWGKWLLRGRGGNKQSSRALAQHFKDTFSREVTVHFVGVWDTVSSVGIGRSKPLPLAHAHEHICFFRHALALDECRVRFLPEYIHGGESGGRSQMVGRLNDEKTDTEMAPPSVKEVWFSGSHSDVGGGITLNDKLDVGDVPCFWMANEAIMAGLELKPLEAECDWNDLKKAAPAKSLTMIWQVLEYLPLKRLSYTNATDTTRAIHRGQGRVIKPGQLIHASVAFKQADYNPSANCLDGRSWSDIIDKGRNDGVDWSRDLTDILEMDFFDHAEPGSLIIQLQSSQGANGNEETGFKALTRLSFFAAFSAGTRSIARADRNFQTLIDTLKESTSRLQTASAFVLYKAARHSTGLRVLRHSSVLQVLRSLLTVPIPENIQAATFGLLARLDKDHVACTPEMQEVLEVVRGGILKPNSISWIRNYLECGGSNTRLILSEGLVWLSQDKYIRAALLKTGAIDSLVKMLKVQDDLVKSCSAVALSKLVAYDEIRASLLKSDGISSLQMMTKVPDPVVKSAGKKTLRKLGKYGKIPARLLRTDAVDSPEMPKVQGQPVRSSETAIPGPLLATDNPRAGLLGTDTYTVDPVSTILRSQYGRRGYGSAEPFRNVPGYVLVAILRDQFERFSGSGARALTRQGERLPPIDVISIAASLGPIFQNANLSRGQFNELFHFVFERLKRRIPRASVSRAESKLGH